MKPKIQRLSAVLAAIIIGSTGVVFALSQVRAAGASIYFSPTSRSVVQGATTSFTVRANTGGANVDTAALTITYDTAQLEFAGVSAGSSPISSPVSPYSNSGNTITGAYYTTTPVSGDIVLATVTFKARASSGTTALQFSTSGANGTLLASGGSDLGASLGSATVSFTAAPTTPAPSNPSNPTPSPTSPSTNKPTTGSSSTSNSGSTSGNPTTGAPTNNDPSSPAAAQTEGDPIIATTDVIPELKVGVFDKNNKPLRNKEVTLHSEPQTAKTDGDGFAIFKNVPIGGHTLTYKQGDTTHEMPVYVATADAQTVVLDITQRNLIIMWTVLAGLALSVAALVTVLVRRSGGFNVPFIKPRGPKTPAGPLGPNGATDFAPPQPHRWHAHTPPSGMVVGGPDGVKKFSEDE